jgi:hypothetical protein
LATHALSCSRRLAGSSVGATKYTWPAKCSPGKGATDTTTGEPTRIAVTASSGTVNRSRRRSTASMRTSAVLLLTRSPGDTRGRPAPRERRPDRHPIELDLRQVAPRPRRLGGGGGAIELGRRHGVLGGQLLRARYSSSASVSCAASEMARCSPSRICSRTWPVRTRSPSSKNTC